MKRAVLGVVTWLIWGGCVSAATASWAGTAPPAPRPGTAPVPVDTTRRGPPRSESVATTSARAPLFPTYAAPGGGLYVPPDLVTLALEDRDEEEKPEIAWSEPRRLAPPEGQPPGTNVRINDPTSDLPGTCNSETHIAAWGRFLVAGWNDGAVFPDSPGAGGYAYSTDWGQTWIDGGLLSTVEPSVYRGDPVITVDGQGNFYYASLYSPDDVASNLSINHGRFVGDSLVWDPPVMPVYSTPADFLDKEWLTCDPANGYVYLTWTRFSVLGGSSIEFSRSLDGGQTWSGRRALTSPIPQGVQGSRILVGPDHELFVMYFVYDYGTQYTFMRCRRSRDFGLTWDVQSNLQAGTHGVISPYGSGPPGFNRGRGIGLPSVAMDRTSGPRRGRYYAVWEESVDYLRDRLGNAGTRLENEPNGSADTANVITIGSLIRGNLEAHHEQDWYQFSGQAGQTVLLYLFPGDTAAGGGDLQLFCEKGRPIDRVMFSELGGGYSFIVYTLPTTGVYYFAVRVAVYTGNYKIATGWHTPVSTDLAQDTRDIVFQSSADGITWDPPKRLSVEGVYTDDAFPEVAVDGSGRVWVDWYGHRSDACGLLTDVYVTQSEDGGETFTPSVKVNDGGSINWNGVATNLVPNMGDYMALIADDCRVYANFTDGRGGTPDSWLALLHECSTPVSISWRGFERMSRGVRLLWQVIEGRPLEVVLERRQESSEWSAVAAGRSDARGTLAIVDADAQRGQRYAYRLVSADRSREALTGAIWVDVPATIRLMLRVAGSRSGAIPVTFALPTDEPARLDVFDVAGRRLRSVALRRDGDDSQRYDVTNLLAGLYWIRLSQGGRQVAARAVVLR
jgi:hypothetical protein